MNFSTPFYVKVTPFFTHAIVPGYKNVLFQIADSAIATLKTDYFLLHITKLPPKLRKFYLCSVCLVFKLLKWFEFPYPIVDPV